MPDVSTHLLFGVSLALLLQRDDERPKQMLTILGAVLLDSERPLTWLLVNTEFYWIGLTSAFHSVLGVVVLSYFAACCVHLEGTGVRERFALVLIGCTSHLLLDMTMGLWVEPGLYLLYPLRVAFSFNLFWNDFWGYPLFGFATLLFSLAVRTLLSILEKNSSLTV